MQIEKENINMWLDEVEDKGFSEKNAKLWKNVYRYASKPRRSRITINLNRLDKVVNENDIIVIPGKVLGVGKITKKFTLSAIEYSNSASKKLAIAGCKIVPINEIIKKKEVKLII
jgi:large subunit ribosomal protein L18e